MKKIVIDRILDIKKGAEDVGLSLINSDQTGGNWERFSDGQLLGSTEDEAQTNPIDIQDRDALSDKFSTDEFADVTAAMTLGGGEAVSMIDQAHFLASLHTGAALRFANRIRSCASAASVRGSLRSGGIDLAYIDLEKV